MKTAKKRMKTAKKAWRQSQFKWQIKKIRLLSSIFWIGHKNLKNISHFFWSYCVNIKTNGRLFHILWPSHNLLTLLLQVFKRLFTIPYKYWKLYKQMLVCGAHVHIIALLHVPCACGKGFATVCAMCVRAAGFLVCDKRLYFCTLFCAKGQDILF